MKIQAIANCQKESIRLDAHGSGDGGASARRGCRLCGGEGNLRRFDDAYLWEGVEERYDQLLYNCFGVRALPPDGVICERCVRQLRNIQRFRALVQAAFATPPAEYSTNQSQMGNGIGEGLTKRKSKSKLKISRIDLPRIGTDNTMKGRVKRKKSILNPQPPVKRVNIACEVCKHKYPMLMPFQGSKFMCSRCKKRDARVNCRRNNAFRNLSELHPKTDLKVRRRLFSVQKIPSNSVKISNYTEPKYHQCSHCFKKYALAENLAKHISDVHKNGGGVCTVCEKDLKTREMLNKHMRTHTGEPIYQCDVCMRSFKAKRSFQMHYLTHGK